MDQREGRVLIIGSINSDLHIAVDVLPSPGETRRGRSVGSFLGGKGANQAVASALLGGEVALIGAVGNDDAGRRALRHLTSQGVDVSKVSKVPAPTGRAVVVVDGNGENQIVVVSGANNSVGGAAAEAIRFENYAVQCLTLELGFEVNNRALEEASAAGCFSILNVSPSDNWRDELADHADMLVLNRHELVDVWPHLDTSTPQALERSLRAQPLPTDAIVVVTLGAGGAYLIEGLRVILIPPLPVRAVDTSGCGDAFLAAIAVSLTAGRSVQEAVEWAVVVGAFVAAREGTQSSYGTAVEVSDWQRGVAEKAERQ